MTDAQPPRKPRLLAYCDSPIAMSGFGQVARNILTLLHETGLFEIEVFGISHEMPIDSYGSPKPSGYPFKIMKANYLTAAEFDKGFDPNDAYGRSKLLKLLAEKHYDVLWTVQDPYVVNFLPEALKKLAVAMKREPIKSIFYFPVDAQNTHGEWLLKPLEFDYPVAYTHFGKAEVMNIASQAKNDVEQIKLLQKSASMRVIPHGTNTKVFRPIDEEELGRANTKKEFFGDEDAYVVLNLNRNQARKDMPRSLMAFRQFKDEMAIREPGRRVVLWMFCKERDVGWDLGSACAIYGLEKNKDVFFAPYPDITNGDVRGMPLEAIAEAYNIADVLISTSMGEGWGLSCTEAMATNLPVIVPRHTSFREIVGEDENGDGIRGFFADCGTTNSEWWMPDGMYKEPLRPLTNVDSLVKQMLYVFEHPEEAKAKAEKAYEWVQEHTWEKIFKEQWLPLFEEVAKSCVKE